MASRPSPPPCFGKLLRNAVMLPRMWEYDDTKDAALASNPEERGQPLSQFFQPQSGASMNAFRKKSLFAGAFVLPAMLGLAGCMSSDAKPAEENAVQEQTKQVSAQMDKPYPMNEKGEILAEIHPAILAAMKENLRKEAKLAAAANLEDLYDPVSGKLRDEAKLAEIQHAADQISHALSKGAAR